MGRTFPITENGVKVYYVTDAPLQTITECFLLTDNVHEFIQKVEALNFEITKHNPSVSLNFDER
ncbi:hypothetical protein [Bacillus thuringiensis]|uniref:hypothetical protein n=1 Tax=Bacillus thuringiensis TaxID=1428 RepID=UPI000BFC9841|nr:hypothetical protein [Bacillus thuringiensis]PGT89839.1 hypothetical protein COD17_08810 [Bacillus thuringiensis]